jgi:NAD(P)-dependent dehydrogenase (short-subunit alcohol dehydrogenase family)
MMTERENVYWIGGGSGRGKSTIARRITARHGMRVYATDDVPRLRSRWLGVPPLASGAVSSDCQRGCEFNCCVGGDLHGAMRRPGREAAAAALVQRFVTLSLVLIMPIEGPNLRAGQWVDLMRRVAARRHPFLLRSM